MIKIALTIQYLGIKYHGFQKQKEYTSIQTHLEKALSVVLRKPIKIIVAGRTDAGVNAYAQVIHFEIQKLHLPIQKLIYSCNCLLPKDIAIIYGKPVPDNFHARFSCREREYVYCIYYASYKTAIFNHYLWVRPPLNMKLMEQSIPYFIGEKDFASFTPNLVQRQKQPTIRTLHEIRILYKEPFIFLYFRGSGFLYNMVRILSSVLLDVGKLKTPIESLEALIQAKNRRLLGKTLPATPLYFVNANYKDYETPKELIPFYSLLKSC